MISFFSSYECSCIPYLVGELTKLELKNCLSN